MYPHFSSFSRSSGNPEGVFAQRGCLPGGVCPGDVFAQGGVCLEEVCLPGGVSARHPLNRITDACENITLSQLRCGR